MERVRAWLERSREVGFLGPGPVDDHIVHARGFAVAVARAPRTVVDLGSGGGVPGLVLAELWDDTTFTLLDSSERRTAFLMEAVAGLGWGSRVRVLRARAEEAGRDVTLRGAADVVVSRSFGPPPATAECAAPLLRVDGLLVVSEPPEAAGDRWPVDGLARLGFVRGETRAVPGAATYQVLRQAALCPEAYPRRVGIPAKRPLW